jgi:hypothetical protein
MNKCPVCSGRFTPVTSRFTRIERESVRVYMVRVNLVNRAPHNSLYAPNILCAGLLKGKVGSPGSPLSVDAHQPTFYAGVPQVNLGELKESTLRHHCITWFTSRLRANSNDHP